jgi:hypothetical protein
MVHPSFEGLPTFTDALSKDERQAFLFFGMVKVHVIVFKEMLWCAKKIVSLLEVSYLQDCATISKTSYGNPYSFRVHYTISCGRKGDLRERISRNQA